MEKLLEYREQSYKYNEILRELQIVASVLESESWTFKKSGRILHHKEIKKTIERMNESFKQELETIPAILKDEKSPICISFPDRKDIIMKEARLPAFYEEQARPVSFSKELKAPSNEFKAD